MDTSSDTLGAPGTFCIVNLGCKVNRAESDTIAASCLAAGAIASSAQNADVVVINTCTVTAEADAKTRKAVRRASRQCEQHGGLVVVTGCAAAIDADALAALGDNIVVEPIRLKAEQVALRRVAVSAASAEDVFATTSPAAIKLRAGDSFKTRMDIKIQDGCDNSCTYCIVHTARGKATSIPVTAVLSEVEAAATSGVREVVLSGINVGSYDFDGVDLPQLIEKMIERFDSVGSDCRIRVSSIEPQHVTQSLVDVLAANPGRLCAHFHIPLQSGCSKTLSAMNRLYDAEMFASKVAMIRSARPDAAISTDVIAGFPQESDEDFTASLDFCRSMGFCKMHVFRYSRRPGTPAAEMQGQVPAEVSAKRAFALRELSDQMALEHMRSLVGRMEKVLMTSDSQGVSESYHDVALEGEFPSGLHGSLVDVEITGVVQDDADIPANGAPMLAGIVK